MKISIDFDGVICGRYTIPRKGGFLGCGPVSSAYEAIMFLSEKYECYVCTNRPKKEHKEIKEWLKLWNFPDMEVTNKKLSDTIAYIDDRAIRFDDNWLSICKLFG